MKNRKMFWTGLGFKILVATLLKGPIYHKTISVSLYLRCYLPCQAAGSVAGVDRRRQMPGSVAAQRQSQGFVRHGPP